VDGRFEPHLFASGSFGIANVRAVVEEAKKTTQMVVPFPEGFRFSSCFRGGYELSTSVAMLID
jgi:hypothetical protein